MAWGEKWDIEENGAIIGVMKRVKTKKKVQKRLFKICVQDKWRQMGRKIHEINVCWPWLKVVLVMGFLLVMGFGIGAAIRHNGEWILGVNNQEKGPVMQESSGKDGKNDVSEEGVSKKESEGAETEKEGQEAVEQKNDEEPNEEQAGEQKNEAGNKITEAEQGEKNTSAPKEELPKTLPEAAAGRKLVALTFDDGPVRATTPRLLEILAEKQVKVTFFVVGSMAEKAPDLLKREVAEGHEVGSHTATHANLAKGTPEVVKWEAGHMDYVFRNTVGFTPTIMRPPYGAVNATARANTPQPMILWSVDPEDWKYRNSGVVREKVVKDCFDGAVVLMHDIYATTVEAVAGIIDDLRARGYEFMTISELAVARGVKLERRRTYGSFRP